MKKLFSMTCQRCQQAAREMDIDTLEAEVVRHRKIAMFWIGVMIAGFLLFIASLSV